MELQERKSNADSTAPERKSHANSVRFSQPVSENFSEGKERPSKVNTMQVPGKSMVSKSMISKQEQKSFDSWSASKIEMMQMGIPEDYIDALLDEGYMERLILANDHQNKKRRLRLQRYLYMNKIIFVFLCMQALLGILVALYKTVFQPDYLYLAEATLQNVDMVLMMDTARHMAAVKDTQHSVVKGFSLEMNKTMVGLRDRVKIGLEENLTDAQEKEQGFFLKYIPFVKYLTAHTAATEAKVNGGWLRMATGAFNAQSTRLLHSFTRDLDEQANQLDAMSNETDYLSSAQWMPAMQRCASEIQHWGFEGAARYCAIVGDNEAMCKKEIQEPVSEFCRVNPTLCPQNFRKRGNLLEYAKELKECESYVQVNLSTGVKGGPINMIMMFTVASEEEKQARLSNEAFRQFIKATTDCEIYRYAPDDAPVYYQAQEGCVRFFMALTLEELAEKSKEVAKLLGTQSNIQPKSNPYQDFKYLFFLLLPLNLVFYVIWSKILRCTQRVRKTADRAMGVKKKMIKVTKTLVEKPRRDTIVELYEANLTEVELAEVSSLRPIVECGASMTMRARLKGGYLHRDVKNNMCNGNGKAFDETSNWMFEPVDVRASVANATGLQCGKRVRIRNAAGLLLKIDENEAAFVGDEQAGGDTATEFIVETLDFLEGDDEETACRLGDSVRVKCVATDKYVRVRKDGTCDGMGDVNETETQFAVDLGGATISPNTVVSLRSIATAEYMYGVPQGGLSAAAGGEAWRYWMLEKKEGVAETTENGQAEEGEEPAQTVQLGSSMGVVKVGDIISLRGINQNMLEVAQNGTVQCGKAAKFDADGVNIADSEGAAAGSGCIDFIIERVGMGMLKKHDATIRAGAQVCLRPLHKDGVTNPVDASDYLSVDSEGQVTADGRVTTPQIGFVLESASVQDMVSPISDDLLRGDVNLMVAPLWNKHDVKRLEALSAAWTSEEDLTQFRGAVVVASAQGSYTVPKAKGDNFQGWVAVVQEGIDLAKAASQAKAQGATGLIVKSSEVLSLEKLTKNISGDKPELPVVFMDSRVATELNERGITLKGCEFKGSKKTAALRSLGKAGAALDDEDMDPSRMKAQMTAATVDVFKNVGALMVEQDEVHRLNPVQEEPGEGENVGEEEEEDGGDAGKGFKWKVAANTHYLWSNSKGGVMNVNFGKKAPPSAAKKVKVDLATGKEVQGDTDASQHRHLRPSLKAKKARGPQLKRMESRTSVVGVSLLDCAEFKSKGLTNELAQVMTQAQVNEQPLEQLDDESDFKIEYAFEEVEVAQGEKIEETLEEEFIDDSGVVVGRFAVPVSRFWLVALGMLGSTVLLAVLLTILLRTQDMFAKRDEAPNSADQGLDVPGSRGPNTQAYSVASNRFWSRSSWIAGPKSSETNTLKGGRPSSAAAAPELNAMTMDMAWQQLRGGSSVGHQDDRHEIQNS